MDHLLQGEVKWGWMADPAETGRKDELYKWIHRAIRHGRPSVLHLPTACSVLPEVWRGARPGGRHCWREVVAFVCSPLCPAVGPLETDTPLAGWETDAALAVTPDEARVSGEGEHVGVKLR